jgi:hypothetical protein
MNIDVLEKYYKSKFGEDIGYITAKQKIVSKINNIEEEIVYETIEKENYQILKTKKNNCLFSNKCKYCNKGVTKEEDRIRFIKNNCCELCFIQNEEGRNGK